ncbi:MAG: LacI family DNA-binding transcriptional regulator [Kiritimatiellae bacterium]|nr:LacI family DNA-binding transcriptional regulator [Kiritimatiellia bacterium]
MGVTIRDVARESGVSMSAVSLVFNNRPGIGRETRERILRVAGELDYRKRIPLAGGGAVRTVRFLKIARHGHTVSRDHDSFIADYIEGIDEGARMAGYNVEVSMFSPVRIEETLELLGAISADGAIVLGTEMSYDDVSKFGATKKPLVILDTWYDYLPFDFVDMNNLDAAFRVIAHFVEHGHRRIGFVKGNVEVENFRLREKGFRQVMKHFALPVDDDSIVPVDATFEGACRDMLAFLGEGGKLPPALFISNDIIAYGCIKAMRECGLSVPGDVSVIGFDDLPMSAVMDIPLTTFSVSKRSMGRRAFELCAARILDGDSRPPEKILIDGRLVERASVSTKIGGRGGGR